MRYAWEANDEDPLLGNVRLLIKEPGFKVLKISRLMKRLSIGYPRAKRLIEDLKKENNLS